MCEVDVAMERAAHVTIGAIVVVGLLVVSGVGASVARDGYGVSLSCERPEKTVETGESTSFNVTIENTGTLDDTYAVTTHSGLECSINGVNVEETPYMMSLQAGQATTFVLDVSVREDALTGKQCIEVTARSQNDTEVYDWLYLYANITCPSNTPPNPPTISGPTSGKIWRRYTYDVTVSDPDGDRIYAMLVDWGDESNPHLIGNADGWPSGHTVQVHHRWKQSGTYTMRVQVRDTHTYGDWETLTVSMPKTRHHYFPDIVRHLLTQLFLPNIFTTTA